GGELQRLAPAAADVEHPHARAQAQLAADQVELGFLRRVQRLRQTSVAVVPVAAAVDQATAEHGLIEVVAEVVVALADGEGAAAELEVQQARGQHVAQVGQ